MANFQQSVGESAVRATGLDKTFLQTVLDKVKQEIDARCQKIRVGASTMHKRCGGDRPRRCCKFTTEPTISNGESFDFSFEVTVPAGKVGVRLALSYTPSIIDHDDDDTNCNPPESCTPDTMMVHCQVAYTGEIEFSIAAGLGIASDADFEKKFDVSALGNPEPPAGPAAMGLGADLKFKIQKNDFFDANIICA